jgi:alpha-N-acetylglucosamine transferase
VGSTGRFRNTLIVGALLLILFSLSRFVDTPTKSHAAVAQELNGLLPRIDDQVNWSDFAYVQYVADENYLCNSLMILEALHRYGAKADRIMMAVWLVCLV